MGFADSTDRGMDMEEHQVEDPDSLVVYNQYPLDVLRLLYAPDCV